MSEQVHPSQVMLFLNRLYSVWDSLLETFGVYKASTQAASCRQRLRVWCVVHAAEKLLLTLAPLPCATPPAG